MNCSTCGGIDHTSNKDLLCPLNLMKAFTNGNNLFATNNTLQNQMLLQQISQQQQLAQQLLQQQKLSNIQQQQQQQQNLNLLQQNLLNPANFAVQSNMLYNPQLLQQQLLLQAQLQNGLLHQNANNQLTQTAANGMLNSFLLGSQPQLNQQFQQQLNQQLLKQQQISNKVNKSQNAKQNPGSSTPKSQTASPSTNAPVEKVKPTKAKREGTTTRKRAKRRKTANGDGVIPVVSKELKNAMLDVRSKKTSRYHKTKLITRLVAELADVHREIEVREREGLTNGQNYKRMVIRREKIKSKIESLEVELKQIAEELIILEAKEEHIKQQEEVTSEDIRDIEESMVSNVPKSEVPPTLAGAIEVKDVIAREMESSGENGPDNESGSPDSSGGESLYSKDAESEVVA